MLLNFDNCSKPLLIFNVPFTLKLCYNLTDKDIQQSSPPTKSSIKLYPNIKTLLFPILDLEGRVVLILGPELGTTISLLLRTVSHITVVELFIIFQNYSWYKLLESCFPIINSWKPLLTIDILFTLYDNFSTKCNGAHPPDLPKLRICLSKHWNAPFSHPLFCGRLDIDSFPSSLGEDYRLETKTYISYRFSLFHYLKKKTKFILLNFT